MRGGYAPTLTIAPNVALAPTASRRWHGAARERRARVMERLCAVASSRRMRMRQSLAQLERAFVDEIEQDREQAERAAARGEPCARAQRHLEKTHKRGSMRFGLLVLMLVATAVLVTVAMFETLYYVMG